MPYIQRRPYVNAEEYSYMEEPSYRNSRPFNNPGSIITFFLLLLLAGWVFMGNNRSPRDFGINWGGEPDVAITAPADAEVRIEPTPRATYRERPVSTPVEPIRGTTDTVIQRQAEVIKTPTLRTKDPNVVGYSWVSAPRVNMRSGPGTNYDLVAILNKYQMVAILNKLELDQIGEVWSKVSFESQGVVKKGWINRSYLSY